MNTTKLYAVANDLGYSSLKLGIKNVDIPTPINKYFNHQEIYPSVIAIQRPQDFTKPVTFDNEQEQDEYFENLQDHLDVSFSSPAIDLPGRFLVGPRALTSGLVTRNFDVNDYSGKSESDLSIILTLARLASQVVSDSYANHEDLTKILSANIVMTTNLPIKEAKKPHVTNNYRDRYMSGKHLITIHNFKQPIVVELTFVDVYVGLEGQMGQFEINNAPRELKKLIGEDFDKSYPKLAGEVDPDTLCKLQNVLGIDIGEGTTDYTVITEGHANPVASVSMSTGYGNVLESAVSILQNENMNIQNRNTLRHFLEEKAALPTKVARQRHARETVYDQLDHFNDDIIQTTSSVMRHAGTDIEAAFVFGGGSIPLLKETNLRQRLVDKLKGFAGGYDIPVIWIDPKYAQRLNMLGLTTYLKYFSKKYIKAHRENQPLPKAGE